MSRTLGIALLGLVLVVALAGVGCSSGAPNPDGTDNPGQETNLSGVTPQSGAVTEDQVAGASLGAVNVTVTDSEGSPLSGVSVYLTPSAMQNELTDYPTAQTDSQGQAGFRGVPLVGNLRVVVRLSDTETLTRSVGTVTAGNINSVVAQDN